MLYCVKERLTVDDRPYPKTLGSLERGDRGTPLCHSVEVIFVNLFVIFHTVNHFFHTVKIFICSPLCDSFSVSVWSVCSVTKVVVSVSPTMSGSVSVNTLVVDPRGTNKIELH